MFNVSNCCHLTSCYPSLRSLSKKVLSEQFKHNSSIKDASSLYLFYEIVFNFLNVKAWGKMKKALLEISIWFTPSGPP